MCPYSDLFWSAFSRIRNAYGPEQLRTWTLFTQCQYLKNINLNDAESFYFFKQIGTEFNCCLY